MRIIVMYVNVLIMIVMYVEDDSKSDSIENSVENSVENSIENSIENSVCWCFDEASE